MEIPTSFPRFTSEQAVDICRITRRTLQYWLEAGYLHPRMVGHHYLWSADELLVAVVIRELVSKRTPRAPSEPSTRPRQILLDPHRIRFAVLNKKGDLLVTDGQKTAWCQTPRDVIRLYKRADRGLHLVDTRVLEAELQARVQEVEA